MDPSTLTDVQVIVGISLIVGVAVTCQVLAPHLRIPALVLLLPAGFVLGILVPGANAQEFLGPAFGPMVDLTVAIILFQGGIDLGRRPMNQRDSRTAVRLVWLGGLITWGAAGLCAGLIIGFPPDLAALFGAIVVVSGPTVVGPILAYARPEKRLHNLLTWEGVMLDPLGALAAVIVFQAIKAGRASDVADGLIRFVSGIGVAVIAALIGALLIRLGVRLAGPNRTIGTQVLIGVVVLMAGLANTVSDDSGLLAALLMGAAVVRLSRRTGREKELQQVMPVFDTFVSMAVGVLFVSISALVTPEALLDVLGPALITSAVLILVVRPAMAFTLTIRAGFTWRERMYIGWLAPRGIVAAATAASIATTLVSLGIKGADDLLPATFTVIAATVVVYGLTARPMAKLLGVAEPDAPAAAARTGVPAG